MDCFATLAMTRGASAPSLLPCGKWSSPAKAGDPYSQRLQRLIDEAAAYSDRPVKRATTAEYGAAYMHCVISCVTARRANHSKPVQPSHEKYSASRSTPNHPYNSRHPAPTRGAYRDRHGRWVRGAVAAACRARKRFSQGELAHERRPRADERRDSGRQSRVVLAPVAGVKPAEVLRNPTGFRKTFNPPAMEAKGIRLQGEHGISRKPIAQGMPGCSGCTCMLVCASI